MDIDEFLSTEAEKSEQMSGKGPKEDFYTDRSIFEQIDKIKDLIKQKDFKEAERVYYVVKESYANLAHQQEQERSKMHREITIINKQLMDNLATLKSEVDKQSEIILQLLIRAKEYMAQRDLKKANSIYIEIRQIFKVLPDAFAEKKMALENEILTFYGNLVNEFNKEAYKHLREKELGINKHINAALQYVKQGKIEPAKKEYTIINQLYTELPDGFLYEKTMIYKKILELFKLAESGAAGIKGEELGLPAAEITEKEMPELGIQSSQKVIATKAKSNLPPIPKPKLSSTPPSSGVASKKEAVPISPPKKIDEGAVKKAKDEVKPSVEEKKEKKSFLKRIFHKKDKKKEETEGKKDELNIEKKISVKKKMAPPPLAP
jgi:hypothetical protein